ncbi:MAG TPA: hypothetical protein VLV87_10915 [Gammaproteobacteria bacterium]|nr:hypothetical protein [Gammaproteobacteria bacterium]
MDTQMKIKAVMAATAALLLLSTVPAQADDAASQGDIPTLYLGKLPITGQQHIVDTLLAIKMALKEPMSDSADKADKVVCRINKGTGDMREYLDCATNRDLAARHEFSQEQMLARRNGLAPGEYEEPTQQDFDGLIAAQPNHRLHVPINGAALQAILDSLPDDAKVVDNGEG